MSDMVKKYVATPGAQFPAKKAESYGKFIDDLSEGRGSLTPERLVEASRSSSAPTHEYFEWDDKKAASQQRLVMARHLLAHISVMVRTGGAPRMVRAFFNVREVIPTSDKGKSVYVSVRRAFADDELKKQVLREAWQELLGWKERYASYKELGPVVHFIDSFGKKKKF